MYPAKCDECNYLQDGCCEAPDFPKCYNELMKGIAEIILDEEM